MGEQITELQTVEELIKGFPVMRQLRTHLSEEEYLTLVLESQEKMNYRQHALLLDDKIVSIIGWMPMTTLYYGQYIWICDLVTDASVRSNGYGEKLLEFTHELAMEMGYGTVALSSGLQRLDAHRFYEEKMGYAKASYVFKWDQLSDLGE
ncbi:GNAT superfamily N-acetyltransferase [Sporosarcina luteola]|nr:GNAT superfamily N-acetyltransferase [Sporosarcina luteola]